MKIAANRAVAKAEPLSPPEGVFAEFCARFGHSETDDQLDAIQDVLADLSSGQATDRLICGDVGFGKTEVALRAAFVAAMSGYQVALVTPTTLLARQHTKFCMLARKQGCWRYQSYLISRHSRHKRSPKRNFGLAKANITTD